MKRKIRPTFLLRTVALLASVVLFLIVLKFTTSVCVTTGTIIFLLLFWFIGIDGGLLPELIEQIAVRRAGHHEGPTDSAWFVDVDREEREEQKRLDDATRNNPTIR